MFESFKEKPEKEEDVIGLEESYEEDTKPVFDPKEFEEESEEE